MNLLILGGTVFVGRHIVESALEQGHQVTLFNRGQHNPHLFPEVEKLRGDRDGNLSALEGRNWDAVIDTFGYIPRIVRASADLLANQVEQYTFISTISVYADFGERGIDEESAVGSLEGETGEAVTPESYGPLKVLCERAVEQAIPERSLVIRPGLIVGPHDPTDRFTYWLWRVARGGEVLAPGTPDQRAQFIDMRDLASWVIRMVEARATGVYHATGPATPLTMGDVLEQCNEVLEGDATFTWVNEEFLLEQNVVPFTDMPLWVPKEIAGLHTVNIEKALTAGLTFRPLKATIRDTYIWGKSRDDSPLRAGISPEREKALLRLWHKQDHETT